MQTRRQSIIEAVTNIIVGYAINVVGQMIIFPVLGIEASMNQYLAVGVAFTAISLARLYVIRRIFNRRDKVLTI